VMVRVPPGRSAEEEAQAERAHRQLADRLQIGDWWDFASDGGRVPMQLIWTSRPPYGCAFANRSATSKTELTLEELAQRMARGLATPGADLDDPLIRRSEQALFDDSYRQLLQQALRDPVTQLPNRKGFMQQLERLTLPEQMDKAHTVGVLEFDQFRMVVNSCGLEAAETLARSLADAVRDQLGPDALMAAFSNDTLAILLPHALHPEGNRIVEALLARMKDYPFVHEQHSYSIGLNIGVCEFEPVSLSPVEAVRRADSACITAKAQGRNRMQAYEAESLQVQTEESLMGWAGRLDAMLKGGDLHLRCQRVQPTAADAGLQPYYEVLLGIEGKDGVRVLPSHFIHAVERLQRAHEVDIWVMRAVFDWIAVHRAQLEAVGGFSINLSASSLSHPEVLRFLQGALADGDFPAHRILFEITETVAIESYGAAQEFMREMRRHGFRFSLDDFGSGFTSYAHLKNLHTDVLKIDGSFVRDMLQNPGDRAMVKSMSDIGHSLGMHTVAEYVESQAVLDMLREIGVDYVQGYAIHVPCAIDDILSQAA
jgi:diguanylate cyclase (GGDEF)-like protein